MNKVSLICFIGSFLSGLVLKSQVFVPFGFFGPKIYIAPGSKITTNQCPTTLSGSLSLVLPYKALTSHTGTSCSVVSQSLNLSGVPLCICSAGTCTATGLTLTNNFLESMTANTNELISGGITYTVSSATQTSSAGSADIQVNTSTWDPNCLGAGLKMWLSAKDTATVTTSYNTTGQYATGTSGAATFTSSVPPNYPIGSKITIAGNATIYEVTNQSLSGSGNFNGDFEKPVVGASSFIYYSGMTAAQQAEVGWSAVGGAVIFSNGSAWGYPTVPSGTQGVSMQGGVALTQTINFPSTGSFTLRWYDVNRPGGGYATNPYTLYLDGVAVGGLRTPAAAWTLRTATLTIATTGDHTIQIVAAPPADALDHCAGLDNFTLNSTVTVTPNLAANYTNAQVSVLGVSAWSDKTANGNNMTQTISTAYYPTWTTNYNGTSQQALLFNGGNLFLSKSSPAFATGTADSTIFVLGGQRGPTSSVAKYAFSYGAGAANQARAVGKQNASNAAIASTYGSQTTVASGSWSSALNTAAGVFSAGNVVGSINGNGDSTSAIAFNTATTTAILGADPTPANYWAGAVSEVMVVNQALTQGYRYIVEGYLAWKYGATAQLPAGHKYKAVTP